PMSDGLKPHVGGTVIEGVSGVLINGIPVAIKGSKCICTGSPKTNAIATGSPGVFIDGEPIAIVGSMTEHGGAVVEGVPGVTISGGFPVRADNPEKLEPRVFNLQWRRKEDITHWGKVGETLILSADTVGYDDGDEVKIKVYEEGYDEPIDEVKGTVKDNRIETEWELKRSTNND
ncbi:MAG: PAAR domain-containing protein, partial [Dysgonomonas sp.]|nr:PAAR domain-containing protein [Dysgonomonas sp.]